MHSFNGAATCSLRNEQSGVGVLGHHHASMGPQLVRCGMSWLPASGFWARSRFNGAATCSLRNETRGTRLLRRIPQLQWGRNLFVAEWVNAWAALVEKRWLQWGRNLFVAECTTLTLTDPPYGMLQWGRNLFVAECSSPAGPTRRGSRRFNGAATCSLRNDPILPGYLGPPPVLQWGRNLFVAECVAGGKKPTGPGVASMGPQLVRCGMNVPCCPFS